MAGSKPEVTARSPRILLLFSALLVMMFSVGNGHTVASLAALLIAALATGCPLLHPVALPQGDWLERAEWMLVGWAQRVPLRPDSLSLLVSSVTVFGWPPPWTYGLLPLVGGGLTALLLALRAPRNPAAFAAAVGLTLLVTILLSKQAFTNYYFLVSGALLIAAVAWPTERPRVTTEPLP